MPVVLTAGRRAAATRAGRLARRAWLFLVLAVAACLSWQTTVTQTHLHLPAVLTVDAGGAAAHAGAELNRAPAPQDSPATCPLCRELAHFGVFLPGAPPMLPAARAVDPVAAQTVYRLAGVLPRRSHAWQGRAPPISTLP